ncbi:hypothetical protein PHMEG_00035695 [Phytophthora megakarya]|uniref:ZSWIM1/3 RNaseH-like domain-containing protein n=1 Tax=Phytophthora megakarya TaxID=4795 RepID=A0A225UNP3_9STRA|nr:hypothetical protein PHMEG_00035695 [Phytophthora megakarya]
MSVTNYPNNRRVTDPNVLDFVDEPVKTGAKPKKILKCLQETTGKRITPRDVRNLVQRLKAKRRGSGTVEARLEIVLRKFCVSQGNSAAIFVDENKTTQISTIQTRQMKRFFEAFPEVMMLDSTHGTNASKYKLFSFMIDDMFGHLVKLVISRHECQGEGHSDTEENPGQKKPPDLRVKAAKSDQDLRVKAVAKPKVGKLVKQKPIGDAINQLGSDTRS